MKDYSVHYKDGTHHNVYFNKYNAINAAKDIGGFVLEREWTITSTRQIANFTISADEADRIKWESMTDAEKDSACNAWWL